MDGDAVREYVERAQSVIEASPQMDEANTKAAILRDFLELLAWDIPTNTQLEYPVKAFGQTYKVDYALVLDGVPVAFLEAKGVDTSLTDAHDDQLSSYMTNENVTYGILTNGKRYRFFQRRVDASNVDVQTVADVTLASLPNRLAISKAYQKDAIQSGESGTILGRINELRGARRTLQTDKDELAVELSNVLADRVSDSITPLAERQAKEMIDRLVADIEAEIDAGDDGSGSDTSGDRSGSDVDDDSTDPDEGRPDALHSDNPDHVVGRIRRAEIEGDDTAQVAVFPTKRSGVAFLRENNAWGFVTIAQNPEFVAMYLSEDVRQIKYVARVRDIVPATEADLARPAEAYFESASDDAQAGFDPDQKVVTFEARSLYELADPVPFETKYPQSLRYTTLEALRTAETTDDML
jgi:predicted type IV restriction endonuclease